MRMKASSYFLIVILVLTASAIGILLSYPSLSAKLLPFIISGLVFVLAAIELIKELSAAKPAREPEKIEQKLERMEARVETRRYVVTIAWILGLVATIILLGFNGGIALFVLCYLKSVGRGWPISLGMSALITAFIYGVFRLALNVDLYTGLLFGGRF